MSLENYMNLFLIKVYFRDRVVLFSFLLILVIQSVMWLYLLRTIHPSTENFFLHYTVLLGIDQEGPWWKLFQLPLVGVGVWCINTVLSLLVYSKDRTLARILVGSILFFQLFLAWIVYLLVGLNV